VADVSLERVGKTYPDGTRAVADLSLSVADGELVVIVGPSGCGKSTVLRMVAGLEAVSAGTVSIGGTVVNDRPPQARDVAMVFQGYALYPHLNVAGNLAFPLRMRRVAKAEAVRRVTETARLLGLEELLDKKPAALSGGERQRVAMGRALVRDPAVFLLDEPLSNLDAALRGGIRASISALQKRTGTTTLYVTHDQVEAMTLGHRVAVMSGGRLRQVDTPRGLYEAPADTFVARFIGSPGCNLFRARVTRAGGRLQVALGDVEIPLPQAVRVRQPGLMWQDETRVVMALRPEALSLAGAGPGPRLPGTVTAVERLGHETLAYVKVDGSVDGKPVVARLSGGEAVREGDDLTLAVETGALRLFDAEGVAL
jgi:multiple sugar transport system ATP-binding protein